MKFFFSCERKNVFSFVCKYRDSSFTWFCWTISCPTVYKSEEKVLESCNRQRRVSSRFHLCGSRGHEFVSHWSKKQAGSSVYARWKHQMTDNCFEQIFLVSSTSQCDNYFWPHIRNKNSILDLLGLIISYSWIFRNLSAFNLVINFRFFLSVMIKLSI